MSRIRRLATLLSLMFAIAVPVSAMTTATHHQHPVSKRHKVIHAAGWAGAGYAAGQAAGPIGSAAVGAAKYRKDLKNDHTRGRAIAKIGAPIAAGAIAGPA